MRGVNTNHDNDKTGRGRFAFDGGSRFIDPVVGRLERPLDLLEKAFLHFDLVAAGLGERLEGLALVLV